VSKRVVVRAWQHGFDLQVEAIVQRDTSIGAAIGVARCGSFVGKTFSFLVVSSG
jgi:hypothetical protein